MSPRLEPREAVMKSTIFGTLAALTVGAWAGAQTQGPNLIGDPGFELGTAAFRVNDAASTIARSTQGPIAGAASLRASSAAASSIVFWRHDPASRDRMRALTVAATFRGEA